MFAKPQEEHEWLQQFVGDWNVSHECDMPDGTKSRTHGTMTCRMLGDLWLIWESEGESPDGSLWTSMLTLGFDPMIEKYVGSFIASSMANVWNYEGVRDAGRKVLPLNTEGPYFDGTGRCNYRDTIQIIDPDRWEFNSEMHNVDGTWTRFMHGRHVRS